MVITYASRHGKNHDFSQDCILINDAVINNFAGTLSTSLKRVAIADGVGGVPGGYEASHYVLKAFAEMKNIESGQELKDRLFEINRNLISHAAKIPEKKAMATTMTGLMVIGHSLWMAHAGNTRLYAQVDGTIIQLSKDHTNYRAMLDEDVEDSGLVDRNTIYCCFGTGKEEYLKSLDVTEIRLEKVPEFIFLTSDGIHDYVDIENINRIFEDNLDDRNKILALMEAAEEGGSQDDCSVVIMRL